MEMDNLDYCIKRVACYYECQLFGYLNNFVILIIMMTKKQCLSYTKKTYAIIKRTIYNRRVSTEIDAMGSREKKKQMPGIFVSVYQTSP
jgi:hypothetical protein